MLRIGVMLLVFTAVAGAFAWTTAGRPAGLAAQQATPVVPTPVGAELDASTSYLVVNTQLEGLPTGPVTVNAATVILDPGASTQAFANPGPTIIGVQEGFVSVESEAASVSNVMVSGIIGVRIAEGTPEPVSGLMVGQGQQVYVPAGARTEIRATGDRPARFLVLAFVPAT